MNNRNYIFESKLYRTFYYVTGLTAEDHYIGLGMYGSMISIYRCGHCILSYYILREIVKNHPQK
jgi:hypothetical protein